MQWIDGSEIDLTQYTGEALCEQIANALWDNDAEIWMTCPDCIRTACLLLELDTDLNMEGIYSVFEERLYAHLPAIIQAFRSIGDTQDAELLTQISRLSPEKDEETICQLEQKLYLWRDLDIWPLLYRYIDSEIAKLK